MNYLKITVLSLAICLGFVSSHDAMNNELDVIEPIQRVGKVFYLVNNWQRGTAYLDFDTEKPPIKPSGFVLGQAYYIGSNPLEPRSRYLVEGLNEVPYKKQPKTLIIRLFDASGKLTHSTTRPFMPYINRGILITEQGNFEILGEHPKPRRK